MGNENSSPKNKNEVVEDAVEEALKKQKQLYERKLQKLLVDQKNLQKQKNEEVVEEALKKQKKIYETKFQKLLVDPKNLQKQKDDAFDVAKEALEEKNTVLQYKRSTHAAVALSTNVSEAHQRTSPIYPILQNYDFPSTSSGYGVNPKPTFFSETTSLPSAPPQEPPQTNKLQRNSHFVDTVNNCSSCCKNLDGAVFICVNRHPCCLGCKQSRGSCVVCGLNMKIRNTNLEVRLARTNLNRNNQKEKCVNAEDGCTLSLYPRDLLAHNMECPFNEMPCPVKMFNGCKWRGKVNQLKLHFGECHPERCEADVNTEMKLRIDEDSHAVYLVVLGNFHFLVHIRVDIVRDLVMMAAQLIGTKISAEKWTYQFHVYNKLTPRRKYQYNYICHNNRMSADEIFYKYDCATLYAQHARSFANNSYLTYKFYLTKHVKKAGEWSKKPSC